MIVNMYIPTLEQLKAFQSREGTEVDHLQTIKSVVYMVDIDDIPTICYYVTPHKTCAEVHMMVTEDIVKYPMTLQKMTKQMIRNAFEVFDIYDKLVMDVAPKDEKWAESLGFQKGPNCDNLESIEGYSNYILKREDI